MGISGSSGLRISGSCVDCPGGLHAANPLFEVGDLFSSWVVRQLAVRHDGHIVNIAIIAGRFIWVGWGDVRAQVYLSSDFALGRFAIIQGCVPRVFVYRGICCVSQLEDNYSNTYVVVHRT